MTGLLLLRLPADPGAPIPWLADDGAGPVARGDDALAGAATHAAGRRVVALAPATCVLLNRVAVPSRKPHHIRQAVPFLLEERLAAEVATLHFAIGPRDADGEVAVAVTERTRLARWLEALAAAGLDPDAVVPEQLALPPADAGWVLAADAGEVLLRTGPQAGAALERTALPLLLAAARTGAAAPPASLTLYGVEAHELGDASDAECELLPQPFADDLLALLARHVPRGPCPLDLRQAAFARTEPARLHWRDWRLPLALAASLVLLLLGQRAWEVHDLDAESARLAATQATLLRETFPGLTRVVDPEAQMRQQLARLRGRGDARFLDLLDASAGALAQEPGWQLSGLSYRDGALQLQLQMPGFDHFERLRDRFATGTPPLQAEVGSLGSVEGQVRGSVTLRGPEA